MWWQGDSGMKLSESAQGSVGWANVLTLLVSPGFWMLVIVMEGRKDEANTRPYRAVLGIQESNTLE